MIRFILFWAAVATLAVVLIRRWKSDQSRPVDLHPTAAADSPAGDDASETADELQAVA